MVCRPMGDQIVCGFSWTFCYHQGTSSHASMVNNCDVRRKGGIIVDLALLRLQTKGHRNTNMLVASDGEERIAALASKSLHLQYNGHI